LRDIAAEAGDNDKVVPIDGQETKPAAKAKPKKRGKKH
jgi:hypothetical protein